MTEIQMDIRECETCMKGTECQRKRTERYSIKIMHTCEYVWLKWHANIEGDLLNCDDISERILKAKLH